MPSTVQRAFTIIISFNSQISLPCNHDESHLAEKETKAY